MSDGHASFSVLGLALTFTLGVIIIILSYTLDPLMTHLQQKYGVMPYRRLEWSANSVLQLQRLAYEEIGSGTWSDADGLVPVTKPRELLVGLDVSNPHHPALSRPRSGSTEKIDVLWPGKDLPEIPKSWRNIDRGNSFPPPWRPSAGPDSRPHNWAK
jgi:hypothetical protein